MNHTLWKDTLRLIRNQKSRYLSVILIVLIGTAFYTGVTASSTMLAQNVDAYNDSLNLKDITIYSNYGFDDDDVEAVGSLADVEIAEGSRFIDVMASDGTTASVTRIHSLNTESQINQFKLVEGRYPQNDSEVLSECGNEMNPGYAIGAVVTLARPDDDLDDYITEETVTVVGTIDTPLYLNMTKENSTLGNQYIDTYLYMNESAFVTDYYTELNVVTTKGKSYNSFYQPYMDYIEGVTDEIEALAKTQTVSRRENIYDEAVSKYEEGLKEYEDGLDAYNTEIADAEKQLSDAFAKIKKGYLEINASQAKINKGRKDLKRELGNNSVESIRNGIFQIDDAISQIDSNLPTLQAASNVSSRVLQSVPSLGSITIREAGTAISEIYNRIPKNESLSEFIESHPEIAKYLKGVDIDALEEMIANGSINQEYLEQLGLTESSTLSDANSALAKYVDELSNTRNTLEVQRQELVEALDKVTSAEAELNAAQKELDAAKKKLDAGYEEYLVSLSEFETRKADAWQELEDAKAELDSAWQEIQNLDECKWTILDRSSHYASETFKNTVHQMKAIADIFPVFFLLVAALVCLTTMTRMVDEERGQIGIMRALGYTRIQCAFRYLFYAGSAAIIGCILGSILGMISFPVVIYNAWKMMYVLPEMKIYISWAVIFQATVAFMVVILLTTWLTCFKDMKEVPSQLLRPKSPKLGKSTMIERISFIWKRLSFTWKVTIRNLIRYKKRLIMTIIGVAGCTALLIVGFGIKDSIQHMVDIQFGELMHYDGSATYEDELLLSEKQSLSDEILERNDVESVELITGYSTLVTSSDEHNNDEETASMLVFDSDSQTESAFTLRTRDGHDPINLTDDGVVISEKLAENMGLSIGDTIVIESKAGLEREARIVAICEMYIYHYVILSQDYYKEIFGTSAGYNEVLITETEDADNLALQSDLLNMDGVDSIYFVDSILENFQSMVDSLDLIVWVLIISSMALAFVVLGNLTNINISERQREIATLKVLGFRPKEVQSYIYNENNILTLAGALVGIPIGNVLHHYIMRQVEMDYVMFGRSIQPQSFLYSIIITVLFGLLVNYFMRKRLDNVLMVESLKSVE